MLLLGWGTLAAQAGISIHQVPMTSQDHLDRLAQAAGEIVVLSDEREELHLVGPGPIWAFMAIAAALRTQGQLKTLVYSEPDCPIMCIF